MPRQKNVVSTLIVDVSDPQSIKNASAQVDKMAKGFNSLDDEVLPKLASDLRIRVFGPMLRALRVYPPRKLGMTMRWKSEKQRRYVMMLLKKAAIARGTPDDLSYRRTGRFGKSWKYTLEITGDALRLRVFNTATTKWKGETHRLNTFIQGNVGLGTSSSSVYRYQRQIQPFHVDRGWNPAAPIVQEYVGKGQDRAVELYNTRIGEIVSE